MGQGSSTSCNIPVDCEPEVAYVRRECEKAGSNALESTIAAAMNGLFGPDLADQLITAYKNARNNVRSQWELVQPDVVSSRNIYEGFKEGASNNNEECVECSCSEAAAKIIAKCQAASIIPSYISDIVDNEYIPPNFAAAITPAPDRWTAISTPGLYEPLNNSKKKEPFNNKKKENFDNIDNNIKLYKFVRDAIGYRHLRFKDVDVAQFQEDCANNSYVSLRQFLSDEKAILDKLYTYYVTSVRSYESLFLQRESVAKIINNKLDELEKIQNKIDSYKTNLHVDNRKNSYQTSNNDFYKYINKFMVIIYYSLFILYLIFSKFFGEKQYKNKKILVILLIYLIIPIILSYLINIIYEGYIYILETNNIKDDTKSYADIIKNKIL